MIGCRARCVDRSSAPQEDYQSDDGPQGHTRMTYEWTDGRFEFRIDKSKDGHTWAPMHEGRYTRVGR
jgi:hypothetical protein